MSNRRSRFTVTLRKPRATADEKIVVLAYGSASAREHYENLGYEVKRVTAGDYRKKARAAKRARVGGFRLDHAALRDAADLLGLKVPVRVRTHARSGPTNGNYQISDDRSYHDIMVKSYLTPEEASSTLWHELTHAMQYERAGDHSAWRQLCSEQSNYTYRNRPIEVEARQMSEDMSGVLLCR